LFGGLTILFSAIKIICDGWPLGAFYVSVSQPNPVTGCGRFQTVHGLTFFYFE